MNKRVGFSADYTFDSGTDTLRQAERVKAPEMRVLDSILFENYQILDGPGSYGFDIAGEKKIADKLTIVAGFAHIDARLLNGDRFPQGNRLHLTSTYKLSPEFSINAALTQGVGPIIPTLPRTRFDLVFSYNILESLKRTKLF